MKSLWAELIGTFTLCFIGQGAICVNQMAGASGPGLIGIAAAHGLALAVMISALGSVSGGHFNPAVTLGFVVTGRQRVGSMIGYWIAQLAGAVVASVLLTKIFPASVWQEARLGAAGLAPGISPMVGAGVEAVLAFFLVIAVWGTEVDARSTKVSGLGVGFTVMMGVLLAGPLTGAAINPARAFGAAVVAGAWDNHWVWWVGPLAGGALASLVYNRLAPLPSVDAARKSA